MQTFLPLSNFSETARCLDFKRLGKQRVEAWQILQALENPKYGWQNHPAKKMWEGHNRLLCLYGLAICDEWISRMFRDSLRVKFYSELVRLDDLWFDGKYSEKYPEWLGEEKLHSSHRAALLAKNYNYYKQFKWSEEPIINYYWPIN